MQKINYDSFSSQNPFYRESPAPQTSEAFFSKMAPHFKSYSLTERFMAFFISVLFTIYLGYSIWFEPTLGMVEPSDATPSNWRFRFSWLVFFVPIAAFWLIICSRMLYVTSLTSGQPWNEATSFLGSDLTLKQVFTFIKSKLQLFNGQGLFDWFRDFVEYENLFQILNRFFVYAGTLGLDQFFIFFLFMCLPFLLIFCTQFFITILFIKGVKFFIYKKSN